MYYRVVDPYKAIINVQNHDYAVSQVAQTSLRSVIGQNNLDQLLSGREKINAHLKDVIDAPTEEPWGILVERVELKDISLPESMKRSMSRQAEAERERRPGHRRRRRVPGIHPARRGRHGDGRRPGRIAAAAAADHGRGRRREAEKNSTLVIPFPVELLRFFDNAPQAASRAQAAAADASTADGSHPATDVPALTAASPAVDVSVTGRLNGVSLASAGQRRLHDKQSRHGALVDVIDRVAADQQLHPGPVNRCPRGRYRRSSRACRATVECAKAPPARISAATQMASMIS